MRMWEILETDAELVERLDELGSAKLSDTRAGRMTLRDLNRAKKRRRLGELEKAKKQDLLVAMYGLDEPDDDALKIEKSELDIVGKRLANMGKAVDVRRKKHELDDASGGPTE